MALLWLTGLLLPWLWALVLACLPERFDRFAKGLALLGATITAACVSGTAWQEPATGAMTIVAEWPWVPELGITVRLVRDGLSMLFALVTVWVGLLVTLYSWSYLPEAQAHAGQTRREAAYYALLSAFVGAMLGLVSAGNLLQFYGFWELTGIVSFLLIGFWHRQSVARAGARRSLVMTVSGGLVMLFGLLLLGITSGLWSFPELFAWQSVPAWGGIIAGCLVIGALAKSAQFPFISWLPGAMTAPTPVSAFLHSSTLVAAGIYLLARFFPLFATEPVWTMLLVTAGTFGILIGGLIALRQDELKPMLAYSTVSQYAFMVLAFGLGTRAGAQAALYAFFVHASIKAGLFLVAGAMTHVTGETCMARIGGIGRSHPGLGLLAAVLALSLGGLPIFGGFYYKEELLHAAYESGAWVLFAAMQLGGLLTLLYMLRFIQYTLLDQAPARQEEARLPWTMATAIVVLTLVPVFTGLQPDWMNRVVLDAASASTVQAPAPFAVELHAGFVLLFSLLVLAFGVVIWALWRRERISEDWLQRVPLQFRLFGDPLLRAYHTFADRCLSLHSGSLRRYLHVELATAVLLAFYAGLHLDWSGLRPSQLPSLSLTLVISTCVMAAAATIWLRQHIAAVLALSISGYALAAVFALLHAPDVALAQVLVETLASFSLVVALRQSRLIHPERTQILRAGGSQSVRWAIALSVGSIVAVATDWAARWPSQRALGKWFATEGYAKSGMQDLVTAILADFRALDTAIEIIVFATAALATLGLFYRYPLPSRQVRRE